jgi:hypothetical protein
MDMMILEEGCGEYLSMDNMKLEMKDVGNIRT